MSFLSDDKVKNLLRRRLSSRYLSSDAFTSSKNRLGRGKANRLGFTFRGRRSLFEIKYTVVKVILLILLLLLVIYSVPTFRYMIHRFFATNIPVPGKAVEADLTPLNTNEFYVAPKYLTTDTFIADPDHRESLFEGDMVVDSVTGVPVGIISSMADDVIVRLFSDPGFKNNFYIKGIITENTPIAQVATSTNVPLESATATPAAITRTALSSTLFEGAGYGEMVAKLPPQKKDIKVGDAIYVQTTHGPKMVAEISRIAEDTSTGSTFTTVFAQLLVSPQSLYRVRMLEK